MSDHAVRLADSAEAFETELAKAVPELLLLDIALPGSDGLAILRQLRVDPRTADLKVAVISNYTDRTIVHDASPWASWTTSRKRRSRRASCRARSDAGWRAEPAALRRF